MTSFMRSKNCMILVISGIVIVGGLVGVTIYYATTVHNNKGSTNSSNPETTIDPEGTEATTFDPENTTPWTDDPESTDPSTDDPETEPITDDPETEPSTDDPETEPSTDDPETEPSTDDPETEPSTDDPVTEPNEPTTPEPEPDPPVTLLFVSTDKGQIFKLDPKLGKYKELVKESNFGIKTFDYYRKNQTLFYATTNPDEPIKSSNDNYENTMEYSARWTKTAMAVDYVTEKIYLIDEVAEKLYVTDLNSEYYAVVLTDLNKPRDIVVDSERRLLFILQESSILSVHLDGQEDSIIVDSDTTKAFAIDQKNGMLYYADDKSIKIVNYVDKTEPKVYVVVSRNILSMAVVDDELYYIATPTNDTSKFLNYCSIPNGCGKLETVEIDASSFLNIKSNVFVENNFVNPCEDDNGGCEQLCISSNNNQSYTCKCNAGWHVNADLNTCSPVEDYLIYIQDNKVKGRTLDDTEKSFVDMDLDLEIFDVKDKEIIHFDYDSYSNILVYSSGSKVRGKNLTDNSEWMIEDDSDCENIPAINWISKDVYIAKNCGNTSYLTIRPLDVNSNDYSTLTKYEGKINSLVVLPNHGKLFFTYHAETSSSTALHNVYVNGQELDSGHYETSDLGLTVDYEKNLVYYIYSVSKQSFGVPFNMSEIHNMVNFPNVDSARSISTFQKYMYVANAKEIWRFAKHDPETEQKLMMSVTDYIQNFRVYSKKVQPIDEDHPCAENNGECQRYCYAFEDGNYECGCNDGEILMVDKTCGLPST